MPVPIYTGSGIFIIDSQNPFLLFYRKNVLATIQDILAAENSATIFFMQTTYENRGEIYILNFC